MHMHDTSCIMYYVTCMMGQCMMYAELCSMHSALCIMNDAMMHDALFAPIRPDSVLEQAPHKRLPNCW